MMIIEMTQLIRLNSQLTMFCAQTPRRSPRS